MWLKMLRCGLMERPRQSTPLWRRVHLLVVAAVLCSCPSRSPIPNAERARDGATPAPTVAPRIILLVGDGMGSAQLDAASLYKTGARDKLFMQSLPVKGQIVTASLSGTTDSAASATAMATGALTFNGRVGMDRDGQSPENLVELAKRSGLATGIVTTTRLAHATPASFTAHVNSRGQYADIAKQIVDLRPDVILGGGSQSFEGRNDARNLVQELSFAGYQVARNAGQLKASPASSGKLLGLFSASDMPYVVDQSPDDDLPSLTEMSLAALQRLDNNPNGFFLMIEGGRIDHACHQNLIEQAIGETLAFDDAVAAVTSWAAKRPDVSIFVTADHETGGLTVKEPGPAGVIPKVSWRWGTHTNATVRFFGQGPGSETFLGLHRDHRWIHSVIKGLITGVFEPPASAIIPDGFLDDLDGVSVEQVWTPADPSSRLERMFLASDERGLGIGLEGLFRWDTGATVVFIDVDYQANDGLAELGLDDTSGLADALLSAIPVPSSVGTGFSADLAFVTALGDAPKLEQTLDRSGLRGLRPPYGVGNSLGRLRVASNFADDVRSKGEITAPESKRGFELFITWDQLYPEGRPADPRLAVWAMQVHEGGMLSGQSLPPWPRPDEKTAPQPLVIRPMQLSD